jgi:hypothetical protein
MQTIMAALAAAIVVPALLLALRVLNLGPQCNSKVLVV